MTFNVEKGNVYVEHVIQTGASLTETYNGNVYKGTDGSHDQIIDEEDVCDDEPMPIYKKVACVIEAMAKDKIINFKNEMACICKIIDEKKIIPGIGYTSFVEIVENNADLPDKCRPNVNDIKGENICGLFPNWRIPGATESRVLRYTKIAQAFIDRYNA